MRAIGIRWVSVACILGGMIYLQAGESIGNLIGLGACPGDLCSILGVLLALCASAACLVALLIFAALWLKDRKRRPRLAGAALYCASVPLGAIAGIPVERLLDDLAERRLAANSLPVMQAIQQFESRYGHPPVWVELLTPTYLPTKPSTGLFHYPEFRISVCNEAGGACEGDRWQLIVSGNQPHLGSSECDSYIFSPSQTVPRNSRCRYRQAHGGWVYEY